MHRCGEITVHPVDTYFFFFITLAALDHLLSIISRFFLDPPRRESPRLSFSLLLPVFLRCLPFVFRLENMSTDSSDRKRFSEYVSEISAVQRRNVATRIEGLAHHQSLMWPYFFGCVTFTTASVLATFKLWGPRNIFRNSMYYARPLPPAISMGVALFGIVYTCRGMLIRNRICIAIEDYEYELKKIQAHHCREGVAQLAWLQFVMDQVKQCQESRFDFEKLKNSPLPVS
ncbi:hypothetical protein AGDE_08644 [Angomonas deanei]|nr:hypothetical protein AGDE_08644 [Angomonas deanei]|eukprot:EPY32489.1 hypothetical protein AGDE_08644 [Angomonas deanei]